LTPFWFQLIAVSPALHGKWSTMRRVPGVFFQQALICPLAATPE
jgi:hypothetical protein